MPTLNVCVQIYMIKKNIQDYKRYKYFSSFQKLCQCIYIYLYIFVLYIYMFNCIYISNNHDQKF